MASCLSCVSVPEMLVLLGLLLGGGCGSYRRGRGERLEAGVQAALVSRNGVLVKDALLDALVERGDGGAELGLGFGDITLGEGFAHEAQAAADAGTVGAVDFRLDDGLTSALERRNMICHCALLVLVLEPVSGNLGSRCRGGMLGRKTVSAASLAIP